MSEQIVDKRRCQIKRLNKYYKFYVNCWKK